MLGLPTIHCLSCHFHVHLQHRHGYLVSQHNLSVCCLGHHEVDHSIGDLQEPVHFSNKEYSIRRHIEDVDFENLAYMQPGHEVVDSIN